MRKIIEKLHAKPEPVRRMVAIAVSLFLTSIVFAVWLHARLNVVSNSTVAEQGLVQESNPMNVLKNNAAEAYQSIKDATAPSSDSDASSQIELLPATTSDQQNQDDQVVPLVPADQSSQSSQTNQ